MPNRTIEGHVNLHYLEVLPLAPNSPLIKYIVDGMMLSTTDLGVVYEIPNISELIAR
jgi:hypothetical protein